MSSVKLLIRLAAEKKKFAAKIVSVATSQEEIGTRGATTAAYAINPHIAARRGRRPRDRSPGLRQPQVWRNQAGRRADHLPRRQYQSEDL